MIEKYLLSYKDNDTIQKDAGEFETIEKATVAAEKLLRGGVTYILIKRVVL